VRSGDISRLLTVPVWVENFRPIHTDPVRGQILVEKRLPPTKKTSRRDVIYVVPTGQCGRGL